MFDEGLVKYIQTKELAIKECKKIEKVRSRLFSLGLIAYCKKDMSFGNISLRYKNKNSFVITAVKTTELPKLNPSYYSLVKKVDTKKLIIHALGASKPSLEAIIHASIYGLNKDIKAVIVVYNKKILEYMFKNNYLTINNKVKVVESINNIYKDIDPFLNNAFAIKGEFEAIVTFGKSLKDAEKTLYEITKKLLN